MEGPVALVSFAFRTINVDPALASVRRADPRSIVAAASAAMAASVSIVFLMARSVIRTQIVVAGAVSETSAPRAAFLITRSVLRTRIIAQVSATTRISSVVLNESLFPVRRNSELSVISSLTRTTAC